MGREWLLTEDYESGGPGGSSIWCGSTPQVSHLETLRVILRRPRNNARWRILAPPALLTPLPLKLIQPTPGIFPERLAE